MHKFGSLYIEGNSFFHRMNPSVKLFMFACWLITVFSFLDLRVSIFLLLLGFILLSFANIPYNISRNLFLVIASFNLINAVFILLLAPDYGVTLSGNNAILYTLFNFKIYTATILYIIVISLKYLSLLPLTLIFVFTTHPSKFASSLNKIGVPYKFAYIASIIFRYFPDIQHEFKTISNAGAARGFSITKDEKSFFKRLKNLFGITVPLINQAMLRIDKISNAMELRGFGRHKKRTWYNQSSLQLSDYIVIGIVFITTTGLLIFRFYAKTGFNACFW